jgi:hypothetical protein
MLSAAGAITTEGWLHPLSLVSTWMRRTARHSREHRTRTQRYDRAVREYERRHRDCLDQHGEACEGQHDEDSSS